MVGDSFKEEGSGQENNNRLAWYRFLLDRSFRGQAEQKFRLQWGPLGMGEYMKALGFLKERGRENNLTVGSGVCPHFLCDLGKCLPL